MDFSEGRGVKTPVWSDNEIMRTEDINFLSYAPYQNFTDNLVKMIPGENDGNTPDTLLTGLRLEHSILLTAILKAGAVVSFRGYYLINEQWGFAASPGDSFSVTAAEDKSLGFTPGHVSDPRIDIVEIRPMQVFYDTKSRKFKDPITGNVTSTLVETKKQYGFEVQIIDGTPSPTPVAPSRTEGWIKIAEVTVASGASEITQNDIKDVRNSSGWTTEPEVTTLLSAILPIREATSVDLSKYTGDVSIVVSEATPFTITLSNTLRAGNSLTVVNSSSDALTLTGSSEIVLNPGDSIIINSSGSIMTFTTAKNLGIVVTDSDYTIPGKSNEMYTSTNVEVTTGATDRTITLPAVADSDRRIIRITKKDFGNGRVIITGDGTERIQNALRKYLHYAGEYFELLCDGTAWTVIHPLIQKRFTESLFLNNWRPTGLINDVGSWKSIAWSPELQLLAAVAENGTNDRIMTSPDGIDWILRTSPGTSTEWKDIVWSSEVNLFVAVSISATKVATSPDGINWTGRSVPGNEQLTGVTWSPELTLFVAVSQSGAGGKIMTSPDGITWTQRTEPTGYAFKDVAWSSELGLFVAVSSDTQADAIITSPDGITWTARTNPDISNAWESVMWAAELGLFIVSGIAGSSDGIMTSPDGITWTTRTTPGGPNEWYSVEWSPELSVLIAVGLGGRIMTSSDGVTWTEKTVAIKNDWGGVVWASGLGMFVVVALDGLVNRVMISMVDIQRPPGRVAVNETNYVIRSDTVELYIEVTTGSSDRTITLPPAAINDGRKIRIKKVDSGNGRVEILRLLTDSIENVTRKYLYRINEYYELLSDGVSNWEIINPSIQKRFVASAIAVSSAWEVLTIQDPSNIQFGAFSWSPSLHRIIALRTAGGSGSETFYSSNGRDWTQATVPTISFFRNSVWSPELGLFAAISFTGSPRQAMISPDGINWSVNPLPAPDLSWGDIAWSPELGLFAAVSSDGTSYRVATSPDGITWTLRATPTNVAWRHLIWVSELGLFIASGTSGDPNRIMTSPDGITWTSRNPNSLAVRGQVVWSPELGILLSLPAGPTYDAFIVSENGIDWTAIPFSDEVAAGEGLADGTIWSTDLSIFIAQTVGNRITTSQDGIHWRVGAPLAASSTGLGIWVSELGMFFRRRLTADGTIVVSNSIG